MSSQWTADLRERIKRADESVRKKYGTAVEGAKQVLAGQVLPVLQEAERRLREARLKVDLEAREIKTDRGTAPGYTLRVRQNSEPAEEFSVWIDVNGDTVPSIMVQFGQDAHVDVLKPPEIGSTVGAVEEKILVYVDQVVRSAARRKVVKDAKASLERTLKDQRDPTKGWKAG